MKHNFYISFGVWLVVIPLLGVPIVWRDALVSLSGLFLIVVSLGPIILKKLQPKTKMRRGQNTTSSSTLPLAKGKGGEEKEELRFSDFPSPEQGEGHTK